MFSDARSKKIVLVAHCILNQNSISDGTADYPGTNTGIVELLLKSNVGIVQMPCPELLCLGLDRGDIHGSDRPVVMENTRIRHSLEEGIPTGKLMYLVNQLVFQIVEYISNGFSIMGVIGINRSPSCGVDTTSNDNQEIDGQGVFITFLKRELEKKSIILDFIGIKAQEVEESLIAIQKLMNKLKE